MPEPGGLGEHHTLDFGGAGRIGPDGEWVETLAYVVDPMRAERCYPAIRRYWPDLPDGALVPAYSGIRPKIVPPSVAVQDFLIKDVRIHSVPNLVTLFGIESPGLTASLAIAEKVRALTASRSAQGWSAFTSGVSGGRNAADNASAAFGRRTPSSGVVSRP